jgi:PAS domain S-box-containing protein
MDGRTYPYLELAALPAVGILLLDTRPAFVFSADGRAIRFANAAGMAFLGEASLGDALAHGFAAGSALARHLARLAKLLPAETSRLEMLRFNRGGGPVALPAACRRLNLADGSRAVLAVGMTEPVRESLVARAEKLTDAIGSRDCLAAIIAGDGRVLAASGGFDELTPASGAVDALIDEFAASGMALVKRRLMIDGRPRPAGIVRFTAGAQALSLLVVGPEEEAAATVAPATEARPPVAAEALVPEAEVPLAGPMELPPEEVPAAATTPAETVPSLPVAGSSHVRRFLWEMDRTHRFGFVSGELAEVVGAGNAAVAGRTFEEVAAALGLDPEGRIAAALGRASNWDGSVAWPVEGKAERVAIDLAGFAATGLDRQFAGYRGVGSIHLDRLESMAAPVALGWPAEAHPETLQRGPAEPLAASVPEPRPGEEEIEEAVEGAPLERPPPPAPSEVAAPPAPAEVPPADEAEIERAVEGAPAEEPAPDEAPPAATAAPRMAARPPLVLSEEDIDAVAMRSIEEGRVPPLVVAGAVEVVEEPDLGGEAPPRLRVIEGSQGSAEPASSNIVRLPGQPSRSLPERLTGSEQDAFRRIAEALGARMSEEPAGDGARRAPAPPPARAEATPGAGEVDTRILDKLPAGIVVYRDRRTLFANRALLDMLGYATSEAFAAAGGAEAVFPDASDGGPRPALSEGAGALQAIRADGGTVPVDARLHAVPWAGATALMLSLIRRAEPKPEPVSDQALLDHLIAAERRIDELQAILDTATDGIVVIDKDGRIENINRSAEALFGVEASDVLRQPFTELLAEESRKAALDYLDGLAENGVASVLNDGREVIGRVPKGGLIPMFMTMGRLGDAPKFCAVLRDITHWKNVEEELVAAKRSAETANAQKSEFLARISHEIRTPLNAIIGFSEVMMEERFGPVGSQRYRDYLHDIHVSGTHMLSLINDLLDLSKIEAGKLELAFESVAVNEIIQECVALMQPQANRERIIIRTSLSAGVPNVVADERSLRQILLNLLSNAVKFTGAGGQVIVATALEDNGEVTLRIRDTGIGMSEKDIETALKPFRQVGPKGRGRGEGTGLGLPLTKALVEANRATFAIDSAPNQGTLVKITFPTTRVLAG